ncbi:MAG: hypothetical protein HOI88_00665 [Phycisphaerae bacterium]|jgi:hypothetical protein|nr:hypothetical protein [Phycisphaerae bacterium]MBT6268848.1 hypothetical protein [Phycisphaerae bacterium]MBT6282199.1 hypothetical protein [Phycisphaerae bacterium]
MNKFALLLIVFVVGCTPVATYPPVENSVALVFSNSSNEPVPTILAETLLYAHEHFGGMNTVVFNLPEGVNKETYTIVSEKIGGAIAMETSGQLAYHVTELRKRPFHAEADIVFPVSGGQYEQATIYLSSSLSQPWTVQRERIWMIPVTELPSPNFPTGGNESAS